MVRWYLITWQHIWAVVIAIFILATIVFGPFFIHSITTPKHVNQQVFIDEGNNTATVNLDLWKQMVDGREELLQELAISKMKEKTLQQMISRSTKHECI